MVLKLPRHDMSCLLELQRAHDVQVIGCYTISMTASVWRQVTTALVQAYALEGKYILIVH